MKNTLFSTLLVLALLPVIAYAAENHPAKIAVASNGKDATAAISSKAGKCPYYLIFNDTGKLIEALDNPYKDA